MTRDDMEGRIRLVMVDQWGVDPVRLERECKLGADLGVDSLDVIELVMAAEEEFNVEIPDDEIDGRMTDQTVGDIFDVVTKYVFTQSQAV
jgi:acyl carrier protein